jgi:uncharacterized protein YdhG (YjbR/CyaY superfamily)
MIKGTKSANMVKVRDVEDYLARVPEEARATLEKLRKTIRATVPKAVEVIWYQMPTFKLNGRPLVCVGAFKNHCSLFPMSMAIINAHKEELQTYHTSKGTIRFPIGKPLPAALVKKIVKARIEENEKRANAKVRAGN